MVATRVVSRQVDAAADHPDRRARAPRLGRIVEIPTLSGRAESPRIRRIRRTVRIVGAKPDRAPRIRAATGRRIVDADRRAGGRKLLHGALRRWVVVAIRGQHRIPTTERRRLRTVRRRHAPERRDRLARARARVRLGGEIGAADLIRVAPRPGSPRSAGRPVSDSRVRSDGVRASLERRIDDRRDRGVDEARVHRVARIARLTGSGGSALHWSIVRSIVIQRGGFASRGWRRAGSRRVHSADRRVEAHVGAVLIVAQSAQGRTRTDRCGERREASSDKKAHPFSVRRGLSKTMRPAHALPIRGRAFQFERTA